MSRLKPPGARYNVLWGPGGVTNVFKNEACNVDLSLRMLSIKLVCLLMLCTGQSVQTLSLIKLS